ncbi:MAG: FGGY family carbohydrate kinase [Ilumatobacteraceae bacterium]
MTSECVLAIDLGTGGPKVALVSADGATIAWSSRPVATQFLDGGGAEQDPEEMWTAIVVATHATIAAATRPAPPIVAVAVTSQYMSTVPVAANGMPTGPCVIWMDTRGAEHNLSLLTDESFALFVARHGLLPLPSGNDNVAHIHVLRTLHPDAYAAAAAFLEPMDYVNARLTGRLGATQSTAFGQMVCDNRTWGITEYDAELVAATHLDPDKLAPLMPMNGIVGSVTTAAARELGIAEGLPVTTGTIDSITSAIGSGALTARDASIIVGTTSVVGAHIDEHRSDLGAGIFVVPSPLSERYCVMAENGVGGRALEWAMRLFGYGEDYEAATSDAHSVAAGAEGVEFMPWLLGSLAPQPNDDVRAAFTGLSLHHERRHMVRAVIEGVAVNLAWLLPTVESFVGHEFATVRFGGGGAQSDLWAQLLADALDRPVHQMEDPRATNARGAAFLAFSILGSLSIGDVPSLVRSRAVRRPDGDNRAGMDRALGRLIGLHRALANLTNN